MFPGEKRTILIVANIAHDASRFEQVIKDNEVMSSHYYIVKVGSVREAEDAILQLQETISFVVCDVNAPLLPNGAKYRTDSRKYGAADHLREFTARLGVSINIISTSSGKIDPESGEYHFPKHNEYQLIQLMASMQPPVQTKSKDTGSGREIAALNERAKEFVTQKELNAVIYGSGENPHGITDSIKALHHEIEEIQKGLDELKADVALLKDLISMCKFINKLHLSRFLFPVLLAIAGGFGATEAIQLLINLFDQD